MNESVIEVRACTRVEEFEQMVDLQLRIWGYSERDVVPASMFVVAAKTGGQVIGAYAGAELAGFVLAYSGAKAGRLYLHSHMAATLPQYRDRGIARALKLAQREDALRRGIHLIEWTFDPLQTKNAYFNLCRLGAIMRRYIPDLYGKTTSPLHGGVATDRLAAEWRLDSSRVAEILVGKQPKIAATAERIRVSPSGEDLAGPELAEVQARVRERFSVLFRAGYAVTWFEREPEGGSYLLEPGLADA